VEVLAGAGGAGAYNEMQKSIYFGCSPYSPHQQSVVKRRTYKFAACTDCSRYSFGHESVGALGLRSVADSVSLSRSQDSNDCGRSTRASMPGPALLIQRSALTPRRDSAKRRPAALRSSQAADLHGPRRGTAL